MQRDDYRTTIETAGFALETARDNDEYRFVSERADNATQKYGVTSVSLATRVAEVPRRSDFGTSASRARRTWRSAIGVESTACCTCGGSCPNP